MRLFAGVALACALAAAPAQAARPFTIEDQLSVQNFGRVAFSPAGRWLIAERYGRWGDAPSFDHEFLTHQTTSQIFVTDLRANSPPRPLLPQAAKAGDTFGAFSPDGTRVLVFRQVGHRRKMGVATLATGATRWSGLTADPEVWTAQARWRDDTRVVVIARAPDAPSILLGAGWQTQARTAAAWSANSRGEASGVALGAGRYAGLNPPPPDYDLAEFDAHSGQTRVLAHGPFFEILLSPDGRTVAASEEGELVTPSAATAMVRLSSPHRRRRLSLIDLDTGEIRRPCPACDLAPGTWAWSPDGQALVAAARDQPAFDAGYGYWRFDRLGASVALAPRLRVNLVTGGGIANLTGQAAWLGGDPVVLAKPEGAARPDWWRLARQGEVNLTAAFAPPQGRALAVGPKGLLVNTAAGLVRLPPKGQARVIAAGAWQGAGALPGLPIERLVGTVDHAARLLTPEGHTRPAADLPSRARLVATSPSGDLAAIDTDDHGVRTLSLYRPNSPPRPLLTINQALADVAFSRPVAIPHRGPSGEPLTSWLYLPPGGALGDQRPLIIVPYAGDRYDRPPAWFEPGAVTPLTNVQLMVAQGYAVLVPSLPIGLTDEPAPGLAAAILRAVDAAHVQHPVFSADRLAVWGHSFGGWSALMAGAQSPRFKALIASAPPTDLITLHGNLRLASFAVPEVYMTLTGLQGWAEGGQARMGAPPWKDLDRYARNSPLLQVDRLTAPVMLIYGDMDYDPSQVAALFMALSRQGKDAQLLLYRGEGHVIGNPANLRDLHQRVFAFLADVLGPVAAVPRPAALSPSAASPSPIRASQ
ncbi:S9 family peptidase [Caulobacter segnis]|uniref:Peptidase S9 prolyl oligopeptidase active site domain protein n=2 Tax=Caulobacter segnis TaxID=88688 RepID=D5VKJ4_CAUST|nr:prolyl oligopeptidase family serine peptidase [Caulobacter segnis]ADG11017.1 peptidase S9 prolyl oligopeptidase active site domain protein [Caulobacter segnis ATCC 21756]AVQ02707.1 S9 family peptidase [Caulobacter segnis]